MELKDRLKQARKHAGLTQAELAERAGIKQASISEIERGLTRSSSHLVRLAQICNVDPVWLSEGTRFPDAQWKAVTGGVQPQLEKPPGIESNASALRSIDGWDEKTPLDDDEVEVPFLREVELDAGSGRFVIREDEGESLRFRKKNLRDNNVQFNQAKCVTVRGNSMTPVLRDGATVGVDLGKTGLGDIIDGDLYAINHNGQLRVKQLFRLPTGIRLRSFNRDEHPDEDYSFQQMQDQQIAILGHVFWWGMYAR
ncbi:transcription repressor (endogenous virus) [Pseudomonas phage phiAH14a]|uniref:Transcription repressor n=1 Tax=Pseudomonas phage phiAH14a TaxID=1805958 RepID=A0A1B0VRI7_9CAUD|nr:MULTISPECIES: helix-turn-helix transcriptional regulator [unclassified Pseudomonas]YP_010773056.1 transcription repressor [Pseudomonas phage phiAH14a]AMW64499.1 transcription repressor [Pseudomonas phage phiAH14a]KAA0946724.1 helix-turn-helix transcriptional regulator [Pseudomonas sp. ANT_H4]KAA0953412.1 helix-turn-helix transcriptional regulator [Pseudomonas sp. ANT_H14]